MADPTGITPPYLDPSQYPDYADMQKKQMMASMLMNSLQNQQSQPATPGPSGLAIVPKRGWAQNLSPLVTALMAGKAQNNSIQAQQKYFTGMMTPQQPQSGPQPQATPATTYPEGQGPPPGQPPQSGRPQSGQQPGVTPQAGNNSMLLPGTTPQKSQMYLNMLGQQKYAELLQGPQEWQMAVRAYGGDTDAAARAIQANLQKQGTITARQGESAIIPNAQSGGPPTVFRSPNLPTGGVADYDQNLQLTGSHTAPGVLPSLQAEKFAEESGKAAGTPQKFTGPSGEYLRPGSSVVPGVLNDRGLFARAEGQQPPGSSGAAGPATGAGAPNGPQPPAGTTPGNATFAGPQLSHSQAQAQTQLVKRGTDYQEGLVESNNAALAVKQNLQEMRNLAPTVNTGKGAEARMEAGAWAQAFGVPHDAVVKFFGLDPGSAQAMDKLTGTLAGSQARAISSRGGTNFEFKNFMRMNPNSGLTTEGFSKVLDYMDKQMDVPIDRLNDFAQWSPSHNPAEWEMQHTARWNQQFAQNMKAGKYTVGDVRADTDPGGDLTQKTGKTQNINGKTYVQIGPNRWKEQ